MYCAQQSAWCDTLDCRGVILRAHIFPALALLRDLAFRRYLIPSDQIRDGCPVCGKKKHRVLEKIQAQMQRYDSLADFLKAAGVPTEGEWQTPVGL